MTTKQTPAQLAGLVVGKQYIVTMGDSHSFSVGDAVVFADDDGSPYPSFNRVGDGKQQALRPEQVKAANQTPAQEAGLVVGTTYQMKAGNCDGYPQGTLVTFTNDDGSHAPRFDVPKELEFDGWNYLFVTDVEPVPAEAPTTTSVTFDDTVITVPIEITVITVKRRLTQAEKDAISAIIN